MNLESYGHTVYPTPAGPPRPSICTDTHAALPLSGVTSSLGSGDLSYTQARDDVSRSSPVSEIKFINSKKKSLAPAVRCRRCRTRTDCRASRRSSPRLKTAGPKPPAGGVPGGLTPAMDSLQRDLREATDLMRQNLESVRSRHRSRHVPRGRVCPRSGQFPARTPRPQLRPSVFLCAITITQCAHPQHSQPCGCWSIRWWIAASTLSCSSTSRKGLPRRHVSSRSRVSGSAR